MRATTSKLGKSRVPRSADRFRRRRRTMQRLENRTLLAGDIAFGDLGSYLSDDILQTIQNNVGNESFGDIAIPFLNDQLPTEFELFSNVLRGDLENELNSLDTMPDVAAEDLQAALFDVLGGTYGVLGDLDGSGVVDQQDVQIPVFEPVGGDVEIVLQLAGDLVSVDVLSGVDSQLGIGFLPLEIEVDPTLSLGVGFEFEPMSVAFSNATEEFSFEFDTTEHELTLNLNASLESSTFQATFGIFEGVTIVDQGSSVDVSLLVDIVPESGETDFTGVVGGGANVDLDWELTVEASENLPSLRFDILWDASGDTWGGDGFRIENFEIGVGGILNKILAPVIKNIEPIIEPVHNVVQYAEEPIPVVSDLLNQPYTLLDALEDLDSTGAIPAEYSVVIDVVVGAIEIINTLGDLEFDGEEVYFQLGDFQFSDSNLRDNAARGLSTWDSSGGSLSDVTVEDLSGLDLVAIAGQVADLTEGTVLESFGEDIRDAILQSTQGVSFEIPFLDNPRSLVNLVLGQPENVDIFRLSGFVFNVGDSSMSQGFEAPFELGLTGGLDFELSPVVNFQFGFDALGIVNAVSQTPGTRFADGFFLDDAPQSEALGDDQPPIGASLGAAVTASVGVGIPFLSASINGTIDANLGLEVPEPVGHEGKIRLTQDLGEVLFNVNGSIGGSISFSYKIGFEIFGHCVCHKREHVLAETDFVTFNVDAIYNPFYVEEADLNFASVSGNTLTLNMGDANDRVIDSGEVNESFVVSVNEIEGVDRFVVTFGGLAQILDIDVDDIDLIVADGGTGHDSVFIDESVSADAQIIGGEGNDLIVYGGSGEVSVNGGDGNDEIISHAVASFLFGGAGHDHIVGSSRAGGQGNTIAGGAGFDTIYGGTGTNFLFGGDSRDVIYAGEGEAELHGGGGNDRLFGGDSLNVFRGGGGRDEIHAGLGLNQVVPDIGFNDINDLFWVAGDGDLAAPALEGRNTLSIIGDDTNESYAISDVPGIAEHVGIHAPDGALISVGKPVTISIDALGGEDSVIVNHLHQDILELIAINGSDSLSPDGASDQVFVHGSDQDDLLTVSAHEGIIQDHRAELPNGDKVHIVEYGATMVVDGMSYRVTAMTNAEDSLQVDTFEGNDDVTVYSSTGKLQINTHEGDDGVAFFVDEIGNTDLPLPFAGYHGEVNVDAGAGLANGITVGGQRTSIPDQFQLSDSRITTNLIDIHYVGEQFLFTNLLGTQSHDQFRVLSTRTDTFSIIFGGDGDDTASIHQGGRLDNIRGEVWFNGNNGNNTLLLNDRHAESGNAMVELLPNAITGIAGASDQIPIRVWETQLRIFGSDAHDLEERFIISDPSLPFEINAGNGNDELQVKTMGVHGTFRGQDGDDSVDLTGDLNDMTSTLVVAGNEGNDQVQISDAAAPAGQFYELGPSQFLRGLMEIQFDATLERLDVKTTPDHDTVQIHGEPIATAVDLNLDNGIDTILGPNLASDWVIDGNQDGSFESLVSLSNTESIFGGNQRDIFRVNRPALLIGSSAPMIHGGGGSEIDTIITPSNQRAVFDLETLQINKVLEFSNIERFDGRHENDLMIGNHLENKWHITGENAGHVLSGGTKTRFANIENLSGNGQVDTFLIHDGGSVSGRLHGAADSDWLNYKFFTSPVHVDLELGLATAVGSIVSIENVEGSVADDFLFGNQLGNILRGGDGNDAIVGRVGNDLLLGGDDRDVIIGSENKDRLFGSFGEDLLIGGNVKFDNEYDDLVQIMSQWTREDQKFDQRVLSLETGNDSLSSISLNDQNVSSDGAYDRLYGQADMDWLWEDDLDLLDQGNNKQLGFSTNINQGNDPVAIQDDTDDAEIVSLMAGFTVDGDLPEEVKSIAEPTDPEDSRMAYDVNRDLVVSALDVLLIINHLKRTGTLSGMSVENKSDELYDVNGDGVTTLIDALNVMNQIKKQP